MIRRDQARDAPLERGDLDEFGELLPVESGEDLGFFDAIGVVRKSLCAFFSGVIDAEEFIDEEVEVFGDDLPFKEFVEAAILTEASADEGVEGVDHFAVDLGSCASEADIGDLMLSAGAWATAEVDANFVFVPTGVDLELFDQFEHAVFGFAEGEVTEFDPGAADATLAEVGGIIVEAESGEISAESGQIALGNIDDEEILFIGEADLILLGSAIFGGDFADFGEDAGADAATGKANADPI